MLELYIEPQELFDEKTDEFIYTQGTRLQLEHSLISVRKWESKTHKPFLKEEDKSISEIREYIKCMTINPVKDQSVYNYIPRKDIEKVIEYIKDPMTATWFKKDPNRLGGPLKPGKVITAEIVYCWMFSMNIPLECEKWHLGQLLTLIRVMSEENSTKKTDPKQAARERAILNEQRKAKYKTRG